MDERRTLDPLLGVYVAMVLVPALALATPDGGPGLPPAGRLVAAGAVLAVGVTLLARAVDWSIEQLTSVPVLAVVVAGPITYLPYMILATDPGSSRAIAAVVGLFAVVPGIGIPVGASVVRNRQLRLSATELVTVTVGDRDDGADRSRVIVAGLVGVAVVTVAAAGAVLLSGDVGSSVGTLTTALGGLSTVALLLSDDDGREVAVTDRVVRVGVRFPSRPGRTLQTHSECWPGCHHR
jgi:hypothetical protein